MSYIDELSEQPGFLPDKFITKAAREVDRLRAELAAAPSDNELSRLRCDAERLREIAGMLEPPFDETTICDRVRNELTALLARCERAEKALLKDSRKFYHENRNRTDR